MVLDWVLLASSITLQRAGMSESSGRQRCGHRGGYLLAQITCKGPMNPPQQILAFHHLPHVR